MTNKWDNYNPKPKLSDAERKRFKKRVCKQCGRPLPFLDKSIYCVICRPKYPIDRSWRKNQ